MRQILTWIATLTTLAAGPAAAQITLVLDANFDADTPGEPPDTSLPGPPDGDSLTLFGVSEFGTFTVVESLTGLPDQPLRIERTGNTIGFACNFGLPEAARQCQRLVVRWTAVASSSIPATFFAVMGPDGQSDFLGLINFRSDGSITISPDVGVPKEVQIGSWTQDVPVRFEWHVDRASLLQDVYIDDEPAIEDFLVAWDSSGDVTHFRYSMASQTPFVYGLDDVTIEVIDCLTPIAPASWGRIKSIYR